MIGHFAPGVDIPLHPFFGSMGLAASAAGKTDSAPPWMNAGNMDNKELVAGSTLYIPVNSHGANFEAGDGHAGQGNGEVDITAMETQLTGTFQFIVHKGSLDDPNRLLWPRAETPTHYISMGFDPDLKTATEMAIHNMIAFLSTQDPDHPLLSRPDAYALISVACDVDITQLVDLPARRRPRHVPQGHVHHQTLTAQASYHVVTKDPEVGTGVSCYFPPTTCV